MKALSIQQPFAWLIVNGLKDIENRKWTTGYRGLILIHAGKTWDESIPRGRTGTLLSYYERGELKTIPIPHAHIEQEGMGGIVGYATLQKVVTNHTSPWFVGRYGFVLTQRHPLPFMPLRGMLGLFDVPPEIEAAVNAIIDERAMEEDMRDMQAIRDEWREYRTEGLGSGG